MASWPGVQDADKLWIFPGSSDTIMFFKLNFFIPYNVMERILGIHLHMLHCFRSFCHYLNVVIIMVDLEMTNSLCSYKFVKHGNNYVLVHFSTADLWYLWKKHQRASTVVSTLLFLIIFSFCTSPSELNSSLFGGMSDINSQVTSLTMRIIESLIFWFGTYYEILGNNCHYFSSNIFLILIFKWIYISLKICELLAKSHFEGNL